MSAVHDWATVVMSYESLSEGDRIEVVGYIWLAYYVAAIYRDEEGRIGYVPASSVRLEPWVTRNHTEATAA